MYSENNEQEAFAVFSFELFLNSVGPGRYGTKKPASDERAGSSEAGGTEPRGRLRYR